MSAKTVLLTLAGLAAAGGLVWARMLAPVEARPYPVVAGDVASEAFGRGTIEADREAALGFDLVGRLSEVLVDEGERVTLGQELARLHTEQVQADLYAARTGIAAARSALERLSAEEKRARAALEAAERELARTRVLQSQGAATRGTLDLAEDQARLTRAELDRILAQRVEASRSIEVATGGAEQRRVTVLRATLLAPFEGVITRRLKEPGDTVTVGTTVLRLVDTDRVHVRALVDETVLDDVREGQPVQIVLPGRSLTAAGRVSRVGWEADRQTHEILVEVAPVEPLGRIAVAQRADVWITTAEKQGVPVVPLAAIQQDARGAYCYVDRGGRIEVTRVSLGLVGRDTVEIASGLRRGDTALAPPRPGARLAAGRRWAAP